METQTTNQIKCAGCIHFPLCLAQKGGVNLQLASENNCCYYSDRSQIHDYAEWCINKAYEEKYNEIMELKKHIYELENGIAKSMLGCEFLPDCSIKAVKNFADYLISHMTVRDYMGVKFKQATFTDNELKNLVEMYLEKEQDK